MDFSRPFVLTTTTICYLLPFFHLQCYVYAVEIFSFYKTAISQIVLSLPRSCSKSFLVYRIPYDERLEIIEDQNVIEACYGKHTRVGYDMELTGNYSI